MRPFLSTLLTGLILFGSIAAYSQLVANARWLGRARDSYLLWSRMIPPPSVEERAELADRAMKRTKTYERLIGSSHLIDGMLVNLNRDGTPRDTCDSLLFSALRYVGLVKLGLEAEAREAWRAIELSQANGMWMRHPRCPKSTSRDMMVGLLVAMSQKPEGHAEHLRMLLALIGTNDGYFGTGPRYLSYLTPNIAKLLRVVASGSGVPQEELPLLVREGYSTVELSLEWITPGYEAHLAALSAWVELEATHDNPELAKAERAPWLGWIGEATSWAGAGDLEKQRLLWTTAKLVEIDPKNLFHRYLWLRAAGALSPQAAAQLLTELLEMPQFPEERLPLNCDRSADWLWQRAPRESLVSSIHCNRVYSGGDFLWMAGLLVEALQPHGLYTESVKIDSHSR